MPATPLVVDASVALKWLFNEEDHPEALRLLDRSRSGEIRLLAPDLLVAEVGNALWKRVVRGLIEAGVAIELFDLFLEQAPALFESHSISRPTLRLALAYGRTFYDALYLALALQQSCQLITADEKFFNAMGKDFPFVKLLKGLPLS